MRYDLLSDETCEELQKLLDSTLPLPYETIEAIIEQEYGKSLTEVFNEFNSEPVGSASVSQVHRAVLYDGTVVAVKVKRPGADEYVSRDMAIIRILANLAQLFAPWLRYARLKKLTLSFGDWLERDMDFAGEVENIRIVREHYAFANGKQFRRDLGVAIFPAAHEELCTNNIVVMDFVEGIPLTKAKMIEGDPNYDVQKSVKTYITAAFRCWTSSKTYVFQADPHLSNILVLPNGGVAAVDFGLIEKFSPETTRISRDFLMATYFRNTDEVVRHSLESAGYSYEKYAKVIEKDVEAYLKEVPNQGFGYWFLEMGRIYIKNKIEFPEYCLALGRSLVITDSLAEIFFPGQTTIDILGKDLRRQAFRYILRELRDVDVAPLVYNIVKEAKEMPETLSEIIQDPEEFLQKIRSIINSSKTQTV